MNNKKFIHCFFSAVAATAAFCPPANAAGDHELDFLMRARYGHLEVGDADGQTASVLLRGSVASNWNDYFRTLLEVDHVETFLEDDFSDGVRFNGEIRVPDVPGTEINQALLSFQVGSFSVHAGRQRLEFDNERFIGSISFWQNDQTFDALRGRYNFLTNSHVSQTYIANANRIFGDDADENLSPSDVNYDALNGLRPVGLWGDHEHNTHLTRIELREWDYSQFVAFAYLIDNEDLPTVSNDTFGGIYKFNYKGGAIKYRLEIEAAIQERTEIPDAPSVPYYAFDGGLGLGSFEGGLRYEVLTAKDGIEFITPLASGHEFQGWADAFSEAGTGVEDTSLRIHWRKAPWKLDLRYHFFSEYDGGRDFGTELDFDLTFKPFDRHIFFIRFADFQASSDYENELVDETKIFFNYSFSL